MDLAFNFVCVRGGKVIRSRRLQCFACCFLSREVTYDSRLYSTMYVALRIWKRR